jgi:hypothetical protein
MIEQSRKDTRQVGRIRGRRGGRSVEVGECDRSLTGVSGLAAVDELAGKLALPRTLDAAVGEFKQRDRGLSAGELLVAVASCQLAGGDHLVSLDRLAADTAGQRLQRVPTPAASTAAGLAKRFTPEHFAGIETAIGQVNTRVLDLVGQVRRSALLRTITIDIDTTDIEVYGSCKRGVAYNYQGQRCGRSHIAHWAELGVPLAADLTDGRTDGRSTATPVLRRALAALPEEAAEVRLRGDAGYFAGELAVECLLKGVRFAIGAKRIKPLWAAAARIGQDAWTPAIGLDGEGREGEVAVMPYVPNGWPEGASCLVRRVRVPLDRLSGSMKARRRRTVPQGQLRLAFHKMVDHVHAYSFILTDLDVSTGQKAAEVEHWYRHRTDIEALNRDAKHGAALRHLPSGHEAINTVWMWGALLACAMSAWLQELTGLDRGNGRGRATIATLRRRLICVPARLVRHARRLILRLPPGPQPLPEVLHRLRLLPDPG